MPAERINRSADLPGVVAVLWGKHDAKTGEDGRVRVAVERHVPSDKRPRDIEAEDSQPLTRAELNTLIRTLRRARDQAFGYA